MNREVYRVEVNEMRIVMRNGDAAGLNCLLMGLKECERVSALSG